MFVYIFIFHHLSSLYFYLQTDNNYDVEDEKTQTRLRNVECLTFFSSFLHLHSPMHVFRKHLWENSSQREFEPGISDSDVFSQNKRNTPCFFKENFARLNGNFVTKYNT